MNSVSKLQMQNHAYKHFNNYGTASTLKPQLVKMQLNFPQVEGQHHITRMH